jgi:DNA primase
MEKFQLYKITKEIQEKSNIVEVIGNFIKIKKLGANFVGVCPFHNDTKPSLTISPKKKI